MSETSDIVSRTDHHLENLKAALIRGGLSLEHLEVLLAHETDSHNSQNHAAESVNVVPASGWSVSFSENPSSVPNHGFPKSGPHFEDRSDTEYKGGSQNKTNFTNPRRDSFAPTMPSLGTSNDRDDRTMSENGAEHGSRLNLFPQRGQRTLVLTGFSDRTSFKEMVTSIRGGILLELYFRKDRSVIISFADPVAATAYLAHVKRHDLYISTKRVSFCRM
jgi:hypothetical protein